MNDSTKRVRAEHAWLPTQFDDVRKYPKEAVQRIKHNVREYTLGEEIGNSITHGVAAALGVAALVVMIVTAVRHGGGVLLFSALVFGITIVVEYTMSTLYHALTADKAKRVFKVLDHSAIYLLIAGSYTPFCLVTLAGTTGWVLFGVVWGLAILGMAVEAFWTFRPRWISAVIYVLMGWCVVWCLPTLVSALPRMGLILLVIGGVCYTIGAVFYVLKKVPYMHMVFHIWVVAGTVFQFFAVELFVL